MSKWKHVSELVFDILNGQEKELINANHTGNIHILCEGKGLEKFDFC